MVLPEMLLMVLPIVLLELLTMQKKLTKCGCEIWRRLFQKRRRLFQKSRRRMKIWRRRMKKWRRHFRENIAGSTSSSSSTSSINFPYINSANFMHLPARHSPYNRPHPCPSPKMGGELLPPCLPHEASEFSPPISGKGPWGGFLSVIIFFSPLN